MGTQTSYASYAMLMRLNKGEAAVHGSVELVFHFFFL